MKCPNCRHDTKSDKCPNCGFDMEAVKKAGAASARLYNEGLARAKESDLSGAAESLRKSLEFNKFNIKARNLLGLVYGAYGRLGDALREWVISINLKETDNEVIQYIEDTKRNFRRMEAQNESIKLYNSALESLAQSSDDIAIIQLKKAVDVNPDFVDALNLLACCCAASGQTAKAVASASRVLEIDAYNKDAIRYLSELNPGQSLFKKPLQRPGAVSAANQAEREYDTRRIRQYAYYNKSDKQNVRLSFSHFICALIGALVIWIVFSVYVVPPRLDAKDYEIALLDADLARTKTRLEETAAAGNAEINRLNGEIREWERKYDSLSAELDIQERMNRLNMANNDFMNGEYETAVNAVRGVRLDGLRLEYAEIVQEIMDKSLPILEQTYHNSGMLAFNQQRYEDADEAFRKSVSYVAPDSKLIDVSYYYIGRTAASREDYDTARVYYEKVINEYPDSSYVVYANQRLAQLP